MTMFHRCFFPEQIFVSAKNFVLFLPITFLLPFQELFFSLSKKGLSSNHRLLLGRLKYRLKEEVVWGAGAPHQLLEDKVDSPGCPKAAW